MICYLTTCSLIYTVLNSADFLHNYRKKTNSVPVFLFKCLSVFDFLTCVVVPIKVITEAAKTECFVKKSDNFPNNQNLSCIKRMKCYQDGETSHHHTLMRLYSLVHWTLILTPNFIAAVMAICRFIQIRFPFFPLQIKHLSPLAIMFGVYNLGLTSYSVFDKYSYYYVPLQVFSHNFDIIEKLYLVIFLMAWTSLLCQIISVLTSLLTIQHLYNIRKNPISREAGSTTVSIKSSLKILVTNFGSILNSILMISCMISKSSEPIFITSVLAPVLLSCFNPIVFIMFTPKFNLIQKLRPLPK